MERESMDYDVVIIGGGPSGLSTAIKLAQSFKEKNIDIKANPKSLLPSYKELPLKLKMS